jgi:hypothetical protein
VLAAGRLVQELGLHGGGIVEDGIKAVQGG